MTPQETEQCLDYLTASIQYLGYTQWNTPASVPFKPGQPRFGSGQKREPNIPGQPTHDVDELRKNALAYAKSLTDGNLDRANDLVQEALLRYLQMRETFRDSSNIPAYLHRIVRNLYLEEIRSRSSQNVPLLHAEAQPSGDNLVEDILRNAELDACFDALAELNLTHPEWVQTVLLHYYDGMQLKDVAQMLNQPDSTTRSNHRRALRRLQARIHFFYSQAAPKTRP